jgi:hypothetical protein
MPQSRTKRVALGIACAALILALLWRFWDQAGTPPPTEPSMPPVSDENEDPRAEPRVPQPEETPAISPVEDLPRVLGASVSVVNFSGETATGATLELVASRPGDEIKGRGTSGWEIRRSSPAASERVTVFAQAPLCLERQVEIELLPGPPYPRYSVCILRYLPGFISGRVTGPHRELVKGARAVLHDGQSGTREALTDETGWFRFPPEEQDRKWSRLEVHPPEGKRWQSKVFKGISAPSVLHEIWLLPIDRSAEINAVAPPPPTDMVWDEARTPVEFLLIDEISGEYLGGGGRSRVFSFRFRKVTEGNYKLLASIAGKVYADARVTIRAGQRLDVDLQISGVATLEGRLDETWSPRPVQVRAVPDCRAWREQEGALNSHVPHVLASGGIESISSLVRRTSTGAVDAEGAFRLAPVESGPTVLLFLDEDGRCVGMKKFEVPADYREVVSLGDIPDPGGRREVVIRVPEMKETGEADIRLMGEYFWAVRMPVDIDPAGLSLGSLLPGDYVFTASFDVGPGHRQSALSMAHFTVPEGVGRCVIDFPNSRH